MTDVVSYLKGMMRPRLLIEAARIGAPNYRRSKTLRRLLKQTELPGPQQAAVRLICLEQEMEESRRNAAADYSPTAHVTAMIALLGEAHLLMARSHQENASATSSFLRAI